jgi:hypothetical protein
MAVWDHDCLVVVAKAQNLKVFWRKRLESTVIIFQVLENVKGKFSLLSLEAFKGKRTPIIIPKGFKGKESSLLATELLVCYSS